MIYSFTRATVALRHSTGERGAQATMGAIEYVLSVETHNVMELTSASYAPPSFDAKTNSFHLL